MVQTQKGIRPWRRRSDTSLSVSCTGKKNKKKPSHFSVCVFPLRVSAATESSSRLQTSAHVLQRFTADTGERDKNTRYHHLEPESTCQK